MPDPNGEDFVSGLCNGDPPDPDHQAPSPSDEQRHRAACAAMEHAPRLVRLAARYSANLHDAEDAYQRAMEIALRRAPVTEPGAHLAWLRTVIHREALAVHRERRRDGPAPGADVAETAANLPIAEPAVDVVVAWRQRYDSICEGFCHLTEAQRRCLILASAGLSHADIHQITGYSLRKIERSVLDGRRNLHRWEVRLISGDGCDDLTPSIERVADGEADRRERRHVSRHLRHCAPCRALLEERRRERHTLSGLVPLGLLGPATVAAVPDPGPAMAWWDRGLQALGMHGANLTHTLTDLPSGAIAKVGAGTVAVAVVGLAGLPAVVEHDRPLIPHQDAIVNAGPTAASTPPPPPPMATDTPNAGRSPRTSPPAPAASPDRRPTVARPAPQSAHRPRAATVNPPAPAMVQRPRPAAVPPTPPPSPPPSAPPNPPPSAAAVPPPPTAAPPIAPSHAAIALEFGP